MLKAIIFLSGLMILTWQCSKPEVEKQTGINSNQSLDSIRALLMPVIDHGKSSYVLVPHDVRIKNYFGFLDSLTSAIDTFRNWSLDEYILVHNNLWIIDSLQKTDYYTQKAKGVFLFDQPGKVALHKNDTLFIPDSIKAMEITEKLNSTWIDINIPEYTLRIIQLDDTLLKTKVRVGRNDKVFLELAGHDVDLRTPIGKGKIIRIEKNPIVINPETGKRYEGTHRDDGRFTKMPIIPWLEPEINGIRYGALIHPTTNPETLGYPFSHGCVGTTESDAWVIYYNAPIGTSVELRYDLRIINDKGDTINLPDIYNRNKKTRVKKE